MFKSKVPESFYQKHITDIMKTRLASGPGLCTSLPRFKLRHCDTDIVAMLENSAPPVDLLKIVLFSTALGKFNQEATRIAISVSLSKLLTCQLRVR